MFLSNLAFVVGSLKILNDLSAKFFEVFALPYFHNMSEFFYEPKS
jgi:hypothetical protein